MSNLSDLAERHTDLPDGSLVHLKRLTSSWGVVADFCFSDLMLLVPVAGQQGRKFVVLAHVRPNTGQTLYPTDLLGVIVDEVQRPLVSRVWKLGEIAEGDSTTMRGRERVRLQCIPVRYKDKNIGILVRETALSTGRRQGALERAYLEVFDRIAHMVAEGSFPFAQDDVEPEDAPRVGDGVMLVDEEARFRFASPNAVSAMHRMGVHSYTIGTRLGQVGFDDSCIDTAFQLRAPVTEEIERDEWSFLIRVIPLLENMRPTGAVLIMRDVTELRRRDRLLLSKDATIREIHHRVKNNLQTIAALLRLQTRRSKSEEAKKALAESERKIRSIALVHETLSKETDPVVPLNDIVEPLVAVVQESVSTPEGGITFEVRGDAGDVSGEIATPLAVVLNELMQNAVDHAFPSEDELAVHGHVIVNINRSDGNLVIEVTDDGVGMPEEFSIEDATGLGMSIVKALITGELGGTLEVTTDRTSGGHGTTMKVTIPLNQGTPSTNV